MHAREIIVNYNTKESTIIPWQPSGVWPEPPLLLYSGERKSTKLKAVYLISCQENSRLIMSCKQRMTFFSV